MQEGLAVLETAAGGTAVTGHVAGRVGTGAHWPAPGARAGPSASNPALDRPFALSVLLCQDARSCFQYLSLA